MLDFIGRFSVFAVCHSVLATNRIKELTPNPHTLRRNWYRLGYNALSIVMFAWVMAGWPTAPVIYLVPGIWHLLLRGLQLGLLIVALRCLMQTGISDFIGFSRREGASPLITTGCYAKVRHPLYTLTVLFMLCEPAPSAKWLLLTLLTSAYCIVASRWEEQRLLEQFGTIYRQYQATVPSFIPKLRTEPRNGSH
jgi:protein-S-isoprenylcysteine O-methyltransferase Ste14